MKKFVQSIKSIFVVSEEHKQRQEQLRKGTEAWQIKSAWYI